jgi:peptide/nickel transport system permease protein
MARYLFKRAVWGLITLFVFQTFMFFLAQLLIPGDYASQFRLFLTGEEVERIRQSLGLDLSLGQQYLNWLQNILSGELGPSFSGPSVGEILLSVLPTTLLVFVTGTAIAFLLGQWLGKFIAWRGPGISSGAVTFGAIVLYASFPPWLAFLLSYYIGRRLELWRSLFDLDKSYLLWKAFPIPPETVAMNMFVALVAVVAVLLVVNKLFRRSPKHRLPLPFNVCLLLAGWVGSWYVLGFGPQALDILYYISLPMLAYVLLSFGETTLIMRTSMMDTLHEEYIFAARAKGLPERVVRDKHAARNAVLPVLSRLVTSLPYLLAGLVIVEYSLGFGIGGRMAQLFASGPLAQGLGGVLFRAMLQQEMPLVMGALLFIGVLSVAARLALDVMQVYLDPRIRYGSRTLDSSR